MTAPLDTPAPRVDVLSDILRAFSLRGTLYFRTDFTGDWAVSVPPQTHVSRFHVGLRGGCWVTAQGSAPVRLEAGDLVVVPHGAAHILSSDEFPKAPTPLPEALAQAGYAPGTGPFALGEGGPACNLVCGYFDFDKDVLHPLMQALPSVLHIEGTQSRNFGWLDDAMRFIGVETRDDAPGWQALSHRLAEIIFIQTVRAYMQDAAELPPYAGITDPQIGRALELMHGDVVTPWTVEELARRCGMSRSVFAERFSKLVGQSPLSYLTAWRIQRAKEQLQETEDSVATIAQSVGYSSEAAFSRAFKRLVGDGPARYRTQLRAAE